MKSFLGAVLAAAVLALPQGASAQILSQVREWTMSCGPGAVGCISWNVRLEYDPHSQAQWTGGVTRLSAIVINRQGAGAFTDTGPVLGARGFTLSGLDWTPPTFRGEVENEPPIRPFLGMSSHGDAGVSSKDEPGKITPLSERGGFSWEPIFYGTRLSMVPWMSDYGQVFGCQPPEAPGWLPGWYATCGGSIRFETSILGRLSFAEETAVTASAASFDGGYSVVSETTVLVPEPSTYLLMLTGLFGFGFVAWRRKDALFRQVEDVT